MDTSWSGSALLPCPSMLKLVSLPVASGASLRLTLSDASHQQWDHALPVPEGGGVITRQIFHPAHKPPPLRFVLRLRLQKGGVFVGHYGTCLQTQSNTELTQKLTTNHAHIWAVYTREKYLCKNLGVKEVGREFGWREQSYNIYFASNQSVQEELCSGLIWCIM